MTHRLWTNGVDTYVAESPTDIPALYKAWSRMEFDAKEQGEFIERTDATITIAIPDDYGCPRITKTAAEWIADNGPGLLCSTEY